MTTTLPPSARDLAIYRENQVEYVTTRQLARKYGISQTRVRQIVRKVSNWIAQMLPPKTDLQIEQEQRLAVALAADQLQHQAELLSSVWAATSDPKYLRQQTRVIQAKARLGVLPGAIDDLLPEEEEHRGAGLQACPSQTQSASDANASIPQTHSAGEAAPSVSCIRSPVSSSSPPPQSEIPNPQSEIPIPPPPEDCSPISPREPQPASNAFPAPVLTPSPPCPYAAPFATDDEQIGGLKIIERQLLTMLGNADPADHERLADLNHSLKNIRQELASIAYYTKLPDLASYLAPPTSTSHQPLTPTPVVAGLPTEPLTPTPVVAGLPTEPLTPTVRSPNFVHPLTN